jgi:hypothetical protein
MARTRDDRVMRVFVSSTARDLEDYRARVTGVVLRLEQQPVDMKFFGAREGAPLAECRQLAAGADAVVVIAAHRYGHVPTPAEGGDGEKSITWHEVEAARAAGRPIFAFLVDPAYPWGREKEQDRLVDAQTWEQAQEITRAVWNLRRFKASLGSAETRDLFTTPDDLSAKVTSSLAGWLLRRGRRWRESQAYGLSVAEIRHEHRYLNDAGDFSMTIRYDVENTSDFNVSQLLYDSIAFLVDDAAELERTSTVDVSLEEAAAGRSIAFEQRSFEVVHTQKLDGRDRALTRIYWRPRVAPALPPGGRLVYACTITTKGTERAAFEPSGSAAGFNTNYPAGRLGFTGHAPPTHRVDRAFLATYLRTEDGAAVSDEGVPPASLSADDRVITWTLEEGSVRVLVNYLLRLRFVPAAGGTSP